MTTQEVLDAIARDRARLDAALDALGDDASTLAVTADGWTAKDVLAHMSHWVGQLAFGLRAPVTPPPYLATVEGRPSFDEWNAIVVAHYRATPLAEVKALLDRIMDVLVGRIATKSDDEMNATGAIPWSPERMLWESVGGETFLHWPAHCEDMERAAG